MGKGGRILCIFTPYALTIASLVCIIMVGIGCTNSSSGTLNNLYFFRANLQNLTTTASKSKVSDALEAAHLKVNDGDIKTALEQIQKQFDVADFYTVGLLGYCDGNVTNGDHYEVKECSKPKAQFYFNPIEVWHLEQTGAENALPSSVRKGLDLYKNVSKWMVIAYIVAFVATIVELLVGLFAICSRWGSCVTTLVSIVAFLFTTAASVTATAMFATITGVFNENLKDYGIKGSMGKNIFVATWLAVAFSLGAALFWLFSSCCCSGRSPYNHKNKNPRAITAEKAPYTYEPLGTPAVPPYGNTAYPAPANHNHNQQSSAYEPFRHV
ncbi:hypothetical protein EYZ11_006073 [Aspergillus tanneri]|uniref:Integral membrane protein n=1 Tax=Aspergillus tanneri TaxID=1220188 RepID=A0A4S3JGC7_9EURO|nr:uncharacterized protein ATNIH1004_006107 [Aspergillus tanneri]KAA8647414.1 hypothetical protein ATNIH1004_006107 [Aspergillus tanneri]THC94436.1 hypothetical protein EYZ11_006073 [Aspergillus tanneri]